jgi:hypothetical protein
MIKLFMYKIDATDTSRGYWLGESPDILINSNNPELQVPVEFYGDSLMDVVGEVKKVLVSKGLPTGIQII